MTELRVNPLFPKKALYFGMTAIGLSLALVTVTKLGWLKTKNNLVVPVAYERDYRFVDKPDGSVDIIDVNQTRQVGTLGIAKDQFVRGVLRGFARERRAEDISSLPAFRLMERTDGSVAINDPTTGETMELAAFGHTQVDDFVKLMALGTQNQKLSSNIGGEIAR